MSEVARLHNRVLPLMRLAILSGLTLAVIGLISVMGVTINQTLAIVFSAVIVTVWFHDKFVATLAAILLFVIKSFWVRVAFMADVRLFGDSGFDLLGITPALLLAGLTIIELYSRFAAGERLCPDRTRKLLVAFIIINFLSVLNPSSSPTIGLAGLERNILPNLTMVYLLACVITERKHFVIMAKTLVVLGIVSCVYAIGQYFVGIYPWEIDSFRKMVFENGLAGFLTIGLRGIEFRIFSLCFSYMDFFFTNVLIFAIAMTFKDELTGRWRRLRVLYFVLWIIILALSIERMPMVMTLAVLIVLHYIRATAGNRRKMIWRWAPILAFFYISLLLAGPILEATGAAKLIRLAELANPFAATSINDRAENKWGPSLDIIKANPLGVGIGYGSQTKAKEDAAKTGLLVQPHNEIIQKTLETGYIGGLLYLLFLIMIFKDFLIIAKTDSTGQALGFAMLSCTVAFWLCGLVNLPFSGASGLVYWSLCGAAMSLKDRHLFANNKGYQILNNADKNNDEVMQIETCVNVIPKVDNGTK
jgi:O-antigen ligase